MYRFVSRVRRVRHTRAVWLSVIIVAGLAVALGTRLGFAPAARVHDTVYRAVAIGRAYAGLAPLTFLYLFSVAVTTWVIVNVSDRLGTLLLVEHSSTLRVLAERPLAGLVQSAFWLENPWELLIAAALAIALAPVERWLGAFRWACVAVLGHVGATLVVAIAIWSLVALGWAEPSATGGIDVGTSYVFGALAGVALWRLERSRRVPYLIALVTVLVVVGAASPGFAAFGHVVAVALGLACGPMTRAADVRARATGPLYPRVWRV